MRLVFVFVTGVMFGCGEPAPPPDEPGIPLEGAPPEERPVEVPDVVGDDADTAQSTLEDGGFSVIFEPEEPYDPFACTVEDQDPTGEAEPEAEVTLTLVCEIPDVVDQDVDTAQADLENAGYTVRLRPEVDDTAMCTVEGQRPTGEGDLGTEVTLRHDCVPVPDVVGGDAQSARDEIEEGNDLTASFDPEPEGDPSACTVESQDVEGTANVGEDVVLTLDCPGQR